jgi:hypothetical protein
VRHCREIEELVPNLTREDLRVLYGMNS